MVRVLGRLVWYDVMKMRHRNQRALSTWLLPVALAPMIAACGGSEFATDDSELGEGVAASAGAGAVAGDAGVGSGGAGASSGGGFASSASVGEAGGADAATGGQLADGAAGTFDEGCVPGIYVGPLEGVYRSPATMVGFPMNVLGTTTVTLAPTADPSRLTMAGSDFTGNATATVPGPAGAQQSQDVIFTGKLVGELDCATGKLVNAGVINGSYSIGAFPYSFEGPLEADYDAATKSFVNGVWSFTESQLTTYGGEGTWGATLVP